MKKECENKLSIATALEANGNAANNRIAKEYVAPDTRRTRIETEGSFCGSTVNDDPVDNKKDGIRVEEQKVGSTSNYFDGDGKADWDF